MNNIELTDRIKEQIIYDLQDFFTNEREEEHLLNKTFQPLYFAAKVLDFIF